MKKYFVYYSSLIGVTGMGLSALALFGLDACKKTVTTSVNNIQWMKVISDTAGSQGGSNIRATNDGGIILDHFTGNGASVFIRYDKNGNVVWNRVFQNFVPTDFCLTPGNEILSVQDSANFIVVNKMDNNGVKTTLVSYIDSQVVTRVSNLAILPTLDGGCMAYGSYQIQTLVDSVPNAVSKSFYFKTDNEGTVDYKQVTTPGGFYPITCCEENADQTYTFLCHDTSGSSILFNSDLNGFITQILPYSLGYGKSVSYIFNNQGANYLLGTGNYNSGNNSYNTMVVYTLNADLSIKDSLTIPISGINNFGGSYKILFTPLQTGFDLLVSNFTLPPNSSLYITSYTEMVHVNPDLYGYTIYPLQPYYGSQPIGICTTTDGYVVLLYMVLNKNHSAFDYTITKIKNVF